MNKVKKAVVAVAIAAVSVATLAAVGCAGGGAEIDGIYLNSQVGNSTI